MILGSYDTVLGTNSNRLSGKAIQQGALQSNGAAMPYLIGYIKGLNRIAEILLDLIPKYIVTPRTIPVRGLNGKRAYQLVNQKGMSVALMFKLIALCFRYGLKQALTPTFRNKPR